MKPRLLGLLAATALTTAGISVASAADLPSRAAPAPIIAPVPVFTWTGFYVGGQVGYAWGESDTGLFVGTTPVVFTTSDDSDLDGFVGGVHAGYNVQFGSFVVGVEADIEAAGIDNDVTFTTANFSIARSSEINFQGSLRARAGVAFDRALIYATGGLAFANFESSYEISDALGVIGTDSFDETQWGWTLGAGVEYAFTNNLTARIEYRYTQFEEFSNTSTVLADAVAEEDLDFHTVRVGVSYKFGTY
ncbi:outer membrane protein [Microvirga pakistanensis]|uniref:outer membrane protein n=1 Tax=Microvirga pakistanensis TaxID=1682650 RepID=UPI00106C5969|nr:outer membrane protein [Microvirga pakistanensis]